MLSSFRRLLMTDAPTAVILIRILVGCVFLSEGIQKFLFPVELGIGRFEKIGLPSPELLAPFVGAVEILGGLLVVVGFMTRPAASLLLAVMLGALTSTKMPLLLNENFWKMAHESRTDWSMALSLIFLLIVGAGSLSFDAKISKDR